MTYVGRPLSALLWIAAPPGHALWAWRGRRIAHGSEARTRRSCNQWTYGPHAPTKGSAFLWPSRCALSREARTNIASTNNAHAIGGLVVGRLCGAFHGPLVVCTGSPVTSRPLRRGVQLGFQRRLHIQVVACGRVHQIPRGLMFVQLPFGRATPPVPRRGCVHPVRRGLVHLLA